MKRLMTLCIALLGATFMNAQPLTGSFTDCNNNTRDIQATLGTGKALIVAHKGVDCSICISQAPGLQTWAAANKTKVDVWGAITYKYNPNTFSTPCPTTTAWFTTHGWTDIFTFPDNNRVFYNNATPRYYVYSPRDSTIKYSGSNRTTAYSVALAESTVGIEDYQLESNIDWTMSYNQLQLTNNSSESIQLRVYDLQGKLYIDRTISAGTSSIDLSALSNSLYLVQFSTGSAAFSEKILIQ